MSHVRPAVVLLGLSLGGGACGAEVFVDHVPLPDPGPAGTLVLGVEGSGGTVLYAIDTARASPVEIPSDQLLPSAPYWAVGLGPRPGELDFDSGRLPPAAEDGLAIFDDLLFIRSRAPRDDEWRQAGRGDLPPSFSAYRLSGAGCSSSFPARPLYEGPGRARFAVAVDEGRALIGLENETLLVTTSSATVLPGSVLGGAFTPGAASGAGADIWLVDALGKVFRSRRRVPLSFARVDAPLGLVIGGFGGERGDDVFLVGQPVDPDPRFPVYRFVADGVWRRLGEVGRFLGAPQGVGPGQAVLLSGERGAVFRFSSTAIDVEEVLGASLAALSSIPGFGTVGGSTDGRLFLRGAEGWIALPGVSPGGRVRGIAPFPRGLVGLLASGILIQRVGRLACTDRPLRGLVDNAALVPLGGGLVLAASFRRQAEVVYLQSGL